MSLAMEIESARTMQELFDCAEAHGLGEALLGQVLPTDSAEFRSEVERSIAGGFGRFYLDFSGLFRSLRGCDFLAGTRKFAVRSFPFGSAPGWREATEDDLERAKDFLMCAL